MNEFLVKEINELGFSKKQIETDLGMPLNSLSAMMSGKRNCPDKWEIKLQQYTTLHALPKTKTKDAKKDTVPDPPKDEKKEDTLPPPPSNNGKMPEGLGWKEQLEWKRNNKK